MRREAILSTAYSVILHGLLFALLAYASRTVPGHGTSKDGMQAADQPQHENQDVTVEIVDPPKTEESEPKQDESEGELDGLLEAAPHADDPCTDFFGGIGITQMYDNRSGMAVVTEVHPGYPAERVGVQTGDILLNSIEIRGEIGSTFILRISRNGEVINLEVTRDKICTEEQSKGTTP